METMYTVEEIETEARASNLAEFNINFEIYPGYILKVKPRPIMVGKNSDDTYQYVIHADIDLKTPVGPVKFVMQTSQETFDKLTELARSSGNVLKLFSLLKSAIPGFGIRPVTRRYPSRG